MRRTTLATTPCCQPG